MNELPEELSVNPVPFIAFIGLDAPNNPDHLTVWNSFAINRSFDRPVLYYKLIEQNRKFPPSKIRKSYERYVPNGLIKKNWLRKHLYLLPAVAALFKQIDWEEIQENHNRQAIITEINHLKSEVINRQVKIVLVLLISKQSPAIDDPLFKDQTTKFCDECDISPKCFFYIPIQNETQCHNAVLKIEAVMNDMARNHYAFKAKLIKTLKDQLNKTTQNYLFVRHEFKLGFYHEIRQIHSTALSHYKNAYTSLIEIRLNPMNCSEIKNIAALLNYKIIKMFFNLNVPLDAISYFKRHIEIFQNKFVSDQIRFEHFDWLSKQYLMFAELFDMAIATFHLAPSATHNPGVYYFESAVYLLKRRSSALESLHQLNQNEMDFASDILAKHKDTDFVGQLPWFQNDSYSDDMKFKVLQFSERSINLTPTLINLYLNVLDQVKKFKKPRFIRFVMFLIGEEYFKMENYKDAMNYYYNILAYYREEKWRQLHLTIIKSAMISAFRLIDYNNFIKCGFEFIANESVPMEFKHSLVNCLISFLRLQYSPFIFDQETNSTKASEWTEKFTAIKNENTIGPIFINIDHDNNFVNCKIRFEIDRFSIEDEIPISVFVLSHLPIDLDHVEFNIKFENSQLDSHCIPIAPISDCLKAESLNVFRFKLCPLFRISEIFAKTIKISEIIFTIKNDVVVKFQWSFSNNRSTVPVSEMNKDSHQFNRIVSKTSAEIVNLESKIDFEIKHHKELLVNENVLIEICIHSKESHHITNINLEAMVLKNNVEIDTSNQWFKFQGDVLAEKKQDERYFLADRLAPGQTLIKEIVFRSLYAGQKKLSMKFNYELKLKHDNHVQIIANDKTYFTLLNVIDPFQFNSSVSNYADPKTSQIRLNEPFRLSYKLKSSCNVPLEILGVQNQLAQNVQMITKSSPQFPCCIHNNETIQESFLLSCPSESSLFALGTSTIQWTRKEKNRCDDEITVGGDMRKRLIVSETTFNLNSIVIQPSMIFIELFLPEKVYARNPFMARYKIHSRMDIDVIIEITMGNAEYFMIAGNRQIKTLLLSKSSTDQFYIFFPLTCGQLSLPKIEISIHSIGQSPVRIDYINQMITSSVFVLPKLRTTINI
ncbi:Trafficking protein particle complex subunit 11 [Sarcoptes scabiei]|nr:Trafficking protein particle complex subunit 11 [Sarcoptes scabiei]